MMFASYYVFYVNNVDHVVKEMAEGIICADLTQNLQNSRKRIISDR